uniref:Filamentous hemagglutinin family N-terminal domain-containing protein n=1 Tax=Candidatus Kentrum sp. DK TaxID=2126562 RepID=A0A450RY43_9GAMM|nr:MAG: filamentous hemagglutinin family N-terminal domain-containing protein [Candidatus Kentron sp. DK]
MKKRNPMGHILQVVWNANKVPAITRSGRSCRRGKAVRALGPAIFGFGALLLIGPYAHAGELPTGGQVAAGAASISDNGTAMTIDQTTQNAAINWQTFSIGANNSVTFHQPSASSVALNRVRGSDGSVILGSLNANGQVFVVNPNGVLFGTGAQVNVGGLVASTLDISTEDFMAGNYRFQGNSAAGITNQGDVTTTAGGTIALIAARVTNTGALNAGDGGNVLIGAGSDVLLDTGGPVKLQVKEAAIDALIEQGGAIRADGGTVLLTAKAAGDIASTVINHTGITEARTLATGEQGEIVLLGDFENDRIEVAGTLDAGAPNGGDGGFIETSAAKVKIADDLNVTTRAVEGVTGEWLIDPVDFTIAASGGDIAGTQLALILNISDVTIHTDTGTDSDSDQYGASGDTGNIYVNDAVTWSANTLTLNAYNNIEVNATLDATGGDGTGTGSLAFEYGQGSKKGKHSTYTVAEGVQVLISSPGAFTWKKGSNGEVKNLVFDNGLLRFGNGTDAVDGLQLGQPFYYDKHKWHQLSDAPLDLMIGVLGDNTNAWNTEGTVLSLPGDTVSYDTQVYSLDISGYQEGYGTIAVEVDLKTPMAIPALQLAAGDNLGVRLTGTYTLSQTEPSLQVDATIENQSLPNISNLRVWLGASNDYVGNTDTPSEFKGNMDGGSFTRITEQDQQAKALKISEDADGKTGGVVYLYSTHADADSVISDEGFSITTGAPATDPRLSAMQVTGESNSYALFVPFSDIPSGQSDSVTFHYEVQQKHDRGRGNKFGHLPKEERGRALAALAIAKGGLGVGRRTENTADSGIDTTVTDTTGIDTAAVETGDGSVATDGAPTTIGGMEVENVSSGDGADAMDADGDSGADAVDLILAQADSNPTGDTVYTVDGGISDGAPETTQADTGVSEDGQTPVSEEGNQSVEGTESGEGAEASEKSGAEEGMETEAGDSEGKKGKAKGKTKEKARGKAKGHDKA